MFGSHLSIAGGLHKALLSAESLGMEAVQIFTASPRNPGAKLVQSPTNRTIAPKAQEVHGFQSVRVQPNTKNQQQWKCKPLDPAAISQWTTERDRLKFRQTVSHDSYLINLASADDALWQKSIDLFIEELCR